MIFVNLLLKVLIKTVRFIFSYFFLSLVLMKCWFNMKNIQLNKLIGLLIAVLLYFIVLFQINTAISNSLHYPEFAQKVKKPLFLQKKYSRKVNKYAVDRSSQNILLIGDSMSKWLRYRLQDYCEANNHHLSTVTWVSGNTKWFAETDTLNYYIKKYNASYVILVLGSNELFIRNIEKNRSGFVDDIVETLSEVKWVWVGPPNWKNDSGINKMLMGKLGEDRFFLSKNLKFQRRSDGMHPTVKSCSMWVDSIVSWITKTSRSRILLNIPNEKRKLLKPDALVLKPI